MGRPAKNLGVEALLVRWGRKIGDPSLQLADLAALTLTSQRALCLYTTGRRHLPILEAKLARVFRLSIPALRRRLGLPAVPGRKQRTRLQRVRLYLRTGDTWIAQVRAARPIPEQRRPLTIAELVAKAEENDGGSHGTRAAAAIPARPEGAHLARNAG